MSFISGIEKKRDVPYRHVTTSSIPAHIKLFPNPSVFTRDKAIGCNDINIYKYRDREDPCHWKMWARNAAFIYFCHFVALPEVYSDIHVSYMYVKFSFYFHLSRFRSRNRHTCTCSGISPPSRYELLHFMPYAFTWYIYLYHIIVFFCRTFLEIQ
jgi:hypothetical protein